MSNLLHVPVAAAAVGLLHVLMACATWLALRGPRPAPALHLWAAGNLVLGLGLGLAATGLAGQATAPLADLGRRAAAACLLLTGVLLRWLGLRHQPGFPLPVGAGLALVVTALAGWAACLHWTDPRTTASYGNAVLAVGAALTGRQAWLTSHRRAARAVRWLAVTQWLLTGTLVVRALALVAETPPTGLLWSLPLAMAALSALLGGLGFLGMAMEEQRRAELQARQAQVDATASREAAEQTAHALQALLLQRDALADEHETLLHLLAHEIRAPLQQAEQALDDAVQVLRDPRDANAAQVQGRLQQVQAVLGEVRAVLDNTLAAATLLGREAPLSRQPVALDFLVELTLGDLGADQLDRLTVEWLTDIDTLRVDPGLVRLALRNLLHNAFLHGGPQVQVGLRLEEVPGTRSLQLVVADNGPGIAAHRLHHQQVDNPAGRRRLGLDIVRRVMDLHGGRLALANTMPRGFSARLVFPLPPQTAGDGLQDHDFDADPEGGFGDLRDLPEGDTDGLAGSHRVHAGQPDDGSLDAPLQRPVDRPARRTEADLLQAVSSGARNT